MDAKQTTAVPKPPRRFRFSLRACFLLVTVLALLFGWRFNRDRSFERQQQICEQLISKLGGANVLWFDRENPPDCGTYERPEGLEFSVEKVDSWTAMFHPEGLRAVTGVSITAPNVENRAQWRDTTMREIVKLTSVREVEVDANSMDAEGIAQLRELPNLTSLSLSDHCITDEHLKSIGALRNLAKLEVLECRAEFFRYDEPATDAGLDYLKGLVCLRQLTLGGMKVSDAGVDALRIALPNCKIVNYRPK